MLRDSLARLSLLVTLLLVLTNGGAQSTTPAGTYYRLPDATATVAADAITIVHGPFHETYVAGLGWLSNMTADPPVFVDGEVLVNGSVLDALGVTEPRLEGIRYSGNAEVRMVLDVPNVPLSQLEALRSGGSRAAKEPLMLELPRMLVPAAAPEDVSGLELELVTTGSGLQLRLSGPAFDYAVFPLENPNRLVIDVTPRRDLSQLVQVEQDIAPGVVYRKYRVFSASGPSVVHLVSMAPGSGELRVVGESRVPRTVTQLASGALIALNAGYFDTSNYAAIGLLKVDHGLLSLPSRGRASVAFSPASPPLIDRLDADVLLYTSRGTLRVGTANGDGVIVATKAGALAGSPTQGVLVVKDGVVVENKIGPRVVPADGFALAYPATNRELALLDTGDLVALDTNLRPLGFDSAQYAVEAGPLLVQDGVAAYDPSLEAFASGQRILDGLTQQAAIGVMPDGTTLFVVAETMRAEDLVELFLGLGVDRAMRFDSGSSTTLVVDGKVMNRSSERKVVSAVVFVAAVAGR
ncbi:MAG TPA: phosphodiester glycosidase family protein [Trueperaceae bacterium]|nr:phosphodiester glycosidase family protein [Trueperaceae bacterium]